jgi:hypothetical protein
MEGSGPTVSGSGEPLAGPGRTRALFPVVALAVLLLLAGCAAPAAEPGRPDPAEDRIGWEAGYWHDDPIDVNNTDGLDEAELDALVARTMARVEYVRGMEFDRRVPVDIVTRDEVDQFDISFSDAEERWMNGEFEALLLLGEDTDAATAFRSLLQQGAGGFYVPEEETLKVIADSSTPRLHGERVIAHELTHALQDQHANLSRRFTRSDPELTFRSVVEGDATLAEALYMRRCGEEWDCLQGPQRSISGAQVQALNSGVALPFTFAYVDGVNFAAARKRTAGWDGVTAAVREPPRTTATILHPERYGREPIRNVSIPDTSGSDWKPVTPPNRELPDTLGQARLSATFVHTLIDSYNPASVVERAAVVNLEGIAINRTDPLDYRVNYTTGWAGDAFRVYHDGDHLGYVLRTAWESPAEAEEFARGYRSVLAHWGGSPVEDGDWLVEDGPFADAFRVRVDGDIVTIVNAPTRTGLEEVHDAGS